MTVAGPAEQPVAQLTEGDTVVLEGGIAVFRIIHSPFDETGRSHPSGGAHDAACAAQYAVAVANGADGVPASRPDFATIRASFVGALTSPSASYDRTTA